MANNFFTKSGNPSTGTLAASSLMRAEFLSIEQGFDKLPTLTSNGYKPIRVNSGGTALEAAAPQIAFFREEQTSGTNAATLTSATWNNRVLNTTVVNAITGCSLSSNTIILPAGTYHIRALSPIHASSGNNGYCIQRVYNDSDSATIVQGITVGVESSELDVIEAQTIFTLAAQKTISIDTYIDNGGCDGGQAFALGYTEIYTEVFIERLY